MKSKTLILLLILSFIPLKNLAQRFDGGLLTGLSTSQVDGDSQKGYKKLGLYAGVFVETDFSEILGLKIELYYIGKGAKKKVDDYEEYNTRLHYVEMPFLLTIKPIDRIQIDLGLAVSYIIGSKYMQYGETIDGALDDMHNFDFGGIGSVTYFFAEKVGFNVRGEYSIVPSRTVPHNWFNNNMSFGILYKF